LFKVLFDQLSFTPVDDTVRAVFGREAADDSLVLRFPSFEEALNVVKRFRNHAGLTYNETDCFINLNRFGKDEVADFFFNRL
jgi:hypothetical protein